MRKKLKRKKLKRKEKPKILYTSYFAKYRGKLAEKIGGKGVIISLEVPEFLQKVIERYEHYPDLAPSKELLDGHKHKGISEKKYEKAYRCKN